MEHDVKSLCVQTNHKLSVYPSFGTVLFERRISMKKIIVWVQAKVVLCFTYMHTQQRKRESHRETETHTLADAQRHG